MKQSQRGNVSTVVAAVQLQLGRGVISAWNVSGLLYCPLDRAGSVHSFMPEHHSPENLRVFGPSHVQATSIAILRQHIEESQVTALKARLNTAMARKPAAVCSRLKSQLDEGTLSERIRTAEEAQSKVAGALQVIDGDIWPGYVTYLVRPNSTHAR